jgi:hypothetical protein
MSERVMVVSGAFATHTTKLYNYYVCPVNWDFQDVDYLAVNYTNEIKYLGKIIQGPLLCHLSEDVVLNLFMHATEHGDANLMKCESCSVISLSCKKIAQGLYDCP